MFLSYIGIIKGVFSIEKLAIETVFIEFSVVFKFRSVIPGKKNISEDVLCKSN